MSNTSRKKSFVRPKVTELNRYKVKVPVESNIYFQPFEHDEITIVVDDEKKFLKTRNSFEANDSETFRKKFAEAMEKFEAFSDVAAILYDKGIRLGDYLIMRGQRYEFPNGKEQILFSGFGKEEVLVSEKDLKEKVIPLYERLEAVNPRVRLCLAWFNRGLSEHQDLEKFLNYWISLEAITPLNSKREKLDVEWDIVSRAITELKGLENNSIRSLIIECIKTRIKFKSISEAMADEIKGLTSEPKVASILSILGESELGKVLKELQYDRSRIAHGEGKEVQEIEKKIKVLHDLIYEVLQQTILNQL